MEKIGQLKIHQQDLSLGVKSGTLYNVQPSFSYRMLNDTTILADGTPDYKTSDPVPFKYNDILITRSRRLDDGTYKTERTPAFCINVRVPDNDSGNIMFASMVFRGSDLNGILTAMENSKKNGTKLGVAKSLAKIIDENKFQLATFFKHLDNGGSIDFAQYKDKYGRLKTCNVKYYNQDVATNVVEQPVT